MARPVIKREVKNTTDSHKKSLLFFLSLSPLFLLGELVKEVVLPALAGARDEEPVVVQADLEEKNCSDDPTGNNALFNKLPTGLRSGNFC